MVHQYCHQIEVRDTSSNGRHNRKFKYYAEQVHLKVHSPIIKHIGYTTDVSEYLNKYFEDLDIDHTKINAFKNVNWLNNHADLQAEIEKMLAEKPKRYKYECGLCFYDFSSKHDMELKCLKCENPLVKKSL
ncbi:hypothetical protein ELUMI_v1c05860 [Williamsoniiplasma luminosum]|nr:hypothetical protein [Williamsoniiplasma luminosum]ATZ17308.1 hypothetical protein ELUMI_v1c05860 [Williamsoniiplasma luminosum]